MSDNGRTSERVDAFRQNGQAATDFNFVEHDAGNTEFTLGASANSDGVSAGIEIDTKITSSDPSVTYTGKVGAQAGASLNGDPLANVGVSAQRLQVEGDYTYKLGIGGQLGLEFNQAIAGAGIEYRNSGLGDDFGLRGAEGSLSVGVRDGEPIAGANGRVEVGNFDLPGVGFGGMRFAEKGYLYGEAEGVTNGSNHDFGARGGFGVDITDNASLEVGAGCSTGGGLENPAGSRFNTSIGSGCSLHGGVKLRF